MFFETWEYKTCQDTDGCTWHWSEFYFRDEINVLVGRSPLYEIDASDYHCLREDTSKVARLLRSGSSWEEVSGSFRQSW